LYDVAGSKDPAYIRLHLEDPADIRLHLEDPAYI
jgi:hypothetical protein